jgi:hypothetical protein
MSAKSGSSTIWLLVSSLALSPVVAQAAPPAAPAAPVAAATPDASADARRHFQQAIALYNDGNFEAALAEFQGAYNAKPAAAILYNIGLTYKALFLYNDSIRTLEQYLKEETKIAPERKAEVEQVLREMRALLADVNLAISPEGANVKLDGRTVGQAPIGSYFIAAGRHVLEVSAEGYVTQTKELMITAGVPIAVTLALKVIPKTGRVRISASPSGASMKVDGAVYVPPVELDLPLGGHTLEVWATGYQVHREELLVAPGQTRDVYVPLRRPPIYKRAALWVPVSIGIVLVVGTAVAVPVALSQRDDRIHGTLTPGLATVGR